jgi:hypothetical protein
MSTEAKTQPDDMFANRMDTEFIKANAQNMRAGFRNRAFVSGNTSTPFYGGAASTTIVGAAMLTVKTSGIFHWAFSWSWTQAATGTYRWQISTQTQAAAIPLTAAAKVGPGAGAATNGAFISTGATIAVTGGPFGSLIQWDSGVITVGTAAVNAAIAASGTFMNSITATVETPFTNGNNIVMLITLITTTAAATTNANGGYAIDLVEQP